MTENRKVVSAVGTIVLLLVMVNVIVIKNGYLIHKDWYRLLLPLLPLLLISIIAYRRNMS